MAPFGHVIIGASLLISVMFGHLMWTTQARFPFKRNRLRCVRCVNENHKKRKRLRLNGNRPSVRWAAAATDDDDDDSNIIYDDFAYQ